MSLRLLIYFALDQLQSKGPKIFHHGFKLGGQTDGVDQGVALLPEYELVGLQIESCRLMAAVY